jgi:hypothetical protein
MAEMDVAPPNSLDDLAARTMDPLTELGIRHGTDKVSHGFCTFYHHHLAASRHGIFKVLEIGVFRGASLRMWRDYFPNAEIHGFDSQKTELTPESRIHLHVGDQADRHSLDSLLEAAGSPFDLIIDDGGHTMEQQQVSFACLFPHLRPGCPYIIEDLHTSFFPTIAVRRGDTGLVVESYPTGYDQCNCTTYQLVDALVRRQPVSSEFLSESEEQYLISEVESAEIFDRDGDRAHITSIIRKKPSMMGARD